MTGFSAEITGIRPIKRDGAVVGTLGTVVMRPSFFVEDEDVLAALGADPKRMDITLPVHSTEPGVSSAFLVSSRRSVDGHIGEVDVQVVADRLARMASDYTPGTVARMAADTPFTDAAPTA